MFDWWRSDTQGKITSGHILSKVSSVVSSRSSIINPFAVWRSLNDLDWKRFLLFVASLFEKNRERAPLLRRNHKTPSRHDVHRRLVTLLLQKLAGYEPLWYCFTYNANNWYQQQQSLYIWILLLIIATRQLKLYNANNLLN